MKRFLRNMPVLLGVVLLLNCEDPPITNPADPNYILSVPTLDTVLGLTDTRIQLWWQHTESQVRSFEIGRVAGPGQLLVMDTVSDLIDHYTDTSCVLGETYRYAIRCQVESNHSEWSNERTLGTTFPAPAGLISNPVDDISVELQWEDVTDFERGFRIERTTGTQFDLIAQLAANQTSYVDTGLEFGTTYHYRVAAYTESNIGRWSEIEAAPQFDPPSNFAAESINDVTLRLFWVDDYNFETGFLLQRDAGNGYQELATLPPGVTEYVDGNLVLNHPYTYRIAALSAHNQGTWGELVAATEFPPPLSIESESLSDTEIRISWEDVYDYESGFRVERQLDQGFVLVGQVGANITEFVDSSPTYGYAYKYRVAGITSSNISTYSDTSVAYACATCVIDVDGNIYETIQIGNQTWMTENLRVTHYKNGDPIPEVQDGLDWMGLDMGAFCYYDNDPGLGEIYGALYNWYAISDSRDVAPDGWHVATEADWVELEMTFGLTSWDAAATGWRGENLGCQLADSASLWDAGVLVADPQFGTSGFGALPGGYRYHDNDGIFASLGRYAYLWVADISPDNLTTWYRWIAYHRTDECKWAGFIGDGRSVRCVKND